MSGGNLSLLRKILLSMMVLGGVGTTVGAGTFASFTASTANDTATIATGSLLLTNKKDGGTDAIVSGTTCFSSGASSNPTDTNANGACDQLINVQVQKPGDVATADLSIQNIGTLSGTLKVKASQLCTTTNAAGQNYSGGGDACVGNRLVIQEYATIGLRTAGDTTGGTCRYGGGAGGQTCSYTSPYRLDAFATSHPHTDALPALDLGTTAGGQLRLFRISVQLPADAPNNLQGVQANFGFTWTLEQTA